MGQGVKLEQLLALQEESRDGDKTVLWIQNLFLINLCEALASQLGFRFNFGKVMQKANDYISKNFEDLKREEDELGQFKKIVDPDGDQKT